MWQSYIFSWKFESESGWKKEIFSKTCKFGKCNPEAVCSYKSYAVHCGDIPFYTKIPHSILFLFPPPRPIANIFIHKNRAQIKITRLLCANVRIEIEQVCNCQKLKWSALQFILSLKRCTSRGNHKKRIRANLGFCAKQKGWTQNQNHTKQGFCCIKPYRN